MKNIILILCLICLCAKGQTFSGGGPHDSGLTNIVVNTNWFAGLTNLIWIDSISITNDSPRIVIMKRDGENGEFTNILILKTFKGTIQIGDSFYRINNITNIIKKTITITNVTQELKK